MSNLVNYILLYLMQENSTTTLILILVSLLALTHRPRGHSSLSLLETVYMSEWMSNQKYIHIDPCPIDLCYEDQ